MTYTEIVKKLIGDIHPHGDSNRDAETFNNLKNMCKLVDELVSEIDRVATFYKGSHEHSVINAQVHASHFLTETLGIKE